MPTRKAASMAEPTRYLSSEDRSAFIAVHAVWELTLACDLKCQHCGSRAGKRRSEELTTDECLDLVRQLARMGTREVTLIGGEAYLRRDWLRIIREIRDQGMDCTLGSLHLTEDRIKAAVDSGLQALGISVDGLRELRQATGRERIIRCRLYGRAHRQEVRHHRECQYADHFTGYSAIA